MSRQAQGGPMADKETIFTLGQKYCPDILAETQEPKSAKELSDILEVPIATCYRRIEDLEAADLLELHDRPLSDEHRRIKVYRRTVDGVEIGFRGGVQVSLDERSAARDRLDQVWRDVAAGS